MHNFLKVFYVSFLHLWFFFKKKICVLFLHLCFVSSFVFCFTICVLFHHLCFVSPFVFCFTICVLFLHLCFVSPFVFCFFICGCNNIKINESYSSMCKYYCQMNFQKKSIIYALMLNDHYRY